MAHIGILCPAAVGHLNPCFSIAHELQRRGHRVTSFQPPDMESVVRNAGVDYRCVAGNHLPRGSLADVVKRLGALRGARATRFTIQFAIDYTHSLLQDAPAMIRAAGIDLLLVDQVEGGAASIAEHAGLPCIEVITGIPLDHEAAVPPFFTGWPYSAGRLARLRNHVGFALFSHARRRLLGVVNEARREWGLPSYRSITEATSTLARISQLPRSLDYPRFNLPPWFHYTGPLLSPGPSREPPFPYDRLSGAPLVYASMGTLQNRLTQVFYEIAAACAAMRVQLVISLGTTVAPQVIGDLPGIPIVVQYAPQMALLKRSAVAITHGGLNSTLESLSCGVPLLAVPIANDQPGVAARLKWSGTGEVLPVQGLHADGIRQVLTRLLGNGPHRLNAKRMQSEIAASGGAARAADIVETVLRTGRPVVYEAERPARRAGLARGA